MLANVSSLAKVCLQRVAMHELVVRQSDLQNVQDLLRSPVPPTHGDYLSIFAGQTGCKNLRTESGQCQISSPHCKCVHASVVLTSYMLPQVTSWSVCSQTTLVN